MDSTKNQTPEYYQNVVVMRHGDRIDNFDPLWIATAPRPWDPPLIKEGRVRAFSTGRKFRNLFGYPLHRVFVSPFLRCVQTAAEAVIALSAVDDNPDALTGDSVTIDPSKLK
ncbi:phosphoglycerate mutase family protein, partial [Trifolium pratense]